MVAPEIMYGVGALILLGTLAWGTWQYNHRNRINDRVTEEATRELYEHPNSYDKQKFEKQVRKS
jgi:hypothetical protein